MRARSSSPAPAWWGSRGCPRSAGGPPAAAAACRPGWTGQTSRPWVGWGRGEGGARCMGGTSRAISLGEGEGGAEAVGRGEQRRRGRLAAALGRLARARGRRRRIAPRPPSPGSLGLPLGPTLPRLALWLSLALPAPR
jgi:hypothetical protein